MRGVAKFARAKEARRPAAEPHPGKPLLPWTGPQRTHDVPDNNGPAAGVEAGGLFRRRGPRRGPGGRGAHPGGPQNRRRRISRWLDPLGFASRVLLRGPN